MILPILLAAAASGGNLRGVMLPHQKNRRGECPKCGGEAKMISERDGVRNYRCRVCGTSCVEPTTPKGPADDK